MLWIGNEFLHMDRRSSTDFTPGWTWLEHYTYGMFSEYESYFLCRERRCVMRKQVGVLVAALLYYSGLVQFARWRMRVAGKHLVILNYHQASGGDLERHMLYLKRHYRMLHLEDALNELYASPDTPNSSTDRRTPLVLTFDDGYHDNYTHAFALACKLQVPITIFLIPGYIESGDYFWWEEGKRLVCRAGVEMVMMGGKRYHLQVPEERAQLSQIIDICLRYASSVSERNATLALFRHQLAVPETMAPEERSRRPLTWAEVQEMQASGWVSFGAHTLHHPILAYLSNYSELQHEVSECRRMLEAHLQCSVRMFAYPVGRQQHIGAEAVKAVREAGYNWAVTTMHGVNTPASDPHNLGRVLGDVSRHWLVMAAETSGIWHVFAPLWKTIIGVGESA
jgi:peptidoglycan/xylan/chitin deacetylase (PgdA/CDA1 family)